LTPELVEWAARAGLTPVGPTFWKYNVIDMAAGLEVEVRLPVHRQVSGDERVRSPSRWSGSVLDGVLG
jgi:hypothetical protein